MTILYDSRSRVKPRRRASFGSGLLAWSPTYRVPYTLADEAWHAERANAAPSVDLDAIAAESTAMDRIEAGCWL